MLHRVRRFFAALSRAQKDMLVLAVATTIAVLIGSDLELFETIHDFSRDHEDWELDEIVLALIFLSFGLMFHTIRRNTDLKTEIRARREAQDFAQRLAHKDPLTGLGNRRYFEEKLAQVLVQTPAQTRALFVLDLDAFKPVNDVYGHQMGDRLLSGFAQKLTEYFGSDAFIARQGGDEFAVVTGPLAESDTAMHLGEGLLKAIETPIVLDGMSFAVTASIGCAMLGAAPATADDVMRRADDALYRAKENGKSQLVFADAALDESRRNRARIETKLRQALRESRLVPHFQPIVDLKSGRIHGHEALARWYDAEEGMVSPSLFIPIAEASGLIGELTDQLLRKALIVARDWPADQVLAFNLSAVQLRDRQLPLKVARLLAETRMPAGRLEIEVTESALIVDLETAQAVLSNLRTLGVLIALDDFGTGYSSLYHLKALKFDRVKIDRTFIATLASDPQSRAITSAILGMTKAMGVCVTAEGIEDEEQLDILIAEGCLHGQGYLFGRPQPAEATQKVAEGVLLHARSAA